jgi:hypothetical protein
MSALSRLWILPIPTAQWHENNLILTPWTDVRLCLMELYVEALSIQELGLLVIGLLWLHLVGFQNGQNQAGEDDVRFQGTLVEGLIIKLCV